MATQEKYQKKFTIKSSLAENYYFYFTFIPSEIAESLLKYIIHVISAKSV